MIGIVRSGSVLHGKDRTVQRNAIRSQRGAYKGYVERWLQGSQEYIQRQHSAGFKIQLNAQHMLRYTLAGL